MSIPRNLSEFLHACGFEIHADPYSGFSMLTSSESDVTKREQNKFDELSEQQLEIVQTATMRVQIRMIALEKAQKDFTYAHDAYLDALVTLDIDDDYETQFEQRDQLERYSLNTRKRQRG